MLFKLFFLSALLAAGQARQHDAVDTKSARRMLRRKLHQAVDTKSTRRMLPRKLQQAVDTQSTRRMLRRKLQQASCSGICDAGYYLANPLQVVSVPNIEEDDLECGVINTLLKTYPDGFRLCLNGKVEAREAGCICKTPPTATAAPTEPPVDRAPPIEPPVATAPPAPLIEPPPLQASCSGICDAGFYLANPLQVVSVPNIEDDDLECGVINTLLKTYPDGFRLCLDGKAESREAGCICKTPPTATAPPTAPPTEPPVDRAPPIEPPVATAPPAPPIVPPVTPPRASCSGICDVGYYLANPLQVVSVPNIEEDDLECGVINTLLKTYPDGFRLCLDGKAESREAGCICKTPPTRASLTDLPLEKALPTELLVATAPPNELPMPLAQASCSGICDAGFYLANPLQVVSVPNIEDDDLECGVINTLLKGYPDGFRLCLNGKAEAREAGCICKTPPTATAPPTEPGDRAPTDPPVATAPPTKPPVATAPPTEPPVATAPPIEPPVPPAQASCSGICDAGTYLANPLRVVSVPNIEEDDLECREINTLLKTYPDGFRLCLNGKAEAREAGCICKTPPTATSPPTQPEDRAPTEPPVTPAPAPSCKWYALQCDLGSECCSKICINGLCARQRKDARDRVDARERISIGPGLEHVRPGSL